MGSLLPPKSQSSSSSAHPSSDKAAHRADGAAHSSNPPPAAGAKRNSGTFSTASTVNLLASRRIIDTFNVGDVAGIHSIIEDAVTTDCDVYIFPVRQHLKGRAALMDLWEAMLEAFPDGVFRASDTTINDKGELITRFVFTGAKQFNIVLGRNEIVTDNTEFGEIVTEVNVSDSRGASSSAGRINGTWSNDGNTMRYASADAVHAVKSSKRVKRDTIDNQPPPSLRQVNAATIGVDYSIPLICSADLLLDDAMEEVYEGCMVMHTNEQYQISRLDYHWKKRSQ